MTPRSRRIATLAALALALALAAPATASARSTFYVDPAATTPANPCTNPAPAKACTTVNAAVTQSEGAGFPGGDDFQVAAGVYAPLALTAAEDSGDSITGSGSGPTGTVFLEDGSTAAAVILGTGAAPTFQTNIVLNDARASNSHGSDRAMIVNAIGAHVENVDVVSTSTATQPALEMNNRNATFDHVSVLQQAPTAAVNASYKALGADGPFTFHDSTISSPATAIEDDSQSGLKLVRTKVSTTSSSDPAISAVANGVALDSSLVTGGDTGLDLAGDSGALPNSIRNTTIDAGAPGAVDGSGFAAVNADSALAASAVSLNIDSSILIEAIKATHSGSGAASIVCTDSDVKLKTQTASPTLGDIDCAAAGGNSTNTPAALFADAPGGDWHLSATSPARDTGGAGALASGQSDTDLDGNPRTLDSNSDCIARRDRGAYELTTQQAPASVCSPPPPGPPGPSGPSGPSGPTGPAGPKPDRTAPRITGLTGHPRTFKRSGHGTEITFTLSEKATVVLRIQVALTGRKVGKSCLAATRARRRRAKCTRYATVRIVTVTGKAGHNEKRIAPKSGRHTLAKGSYHLLARATDPAKNRSIERSVSLKIT
jgi:hypothetical protein